MSEGITISGGGSLVNDLNTTLDTWASYKQMGELGAMGKAKVERNVREAFSSQRDPVTLARWRRRAQTEGTKGAARPLLVKSGALRGSISVALKLQKWQQDVKRAKITPIPAATNKKGLPYGYVHQFGAKPGKKYARKIAHMEGAGRSWYRGKRARFYESGLRELKRKHAAIGGWQLPRRRIFGLSKTDVHEIVVAAERIKWVYLRESGGAGRA